MKRSIIVFSKPEEFSLEDMGQRIRSVIIKTPLMGIVKSLNIINKRGHKVYESIVKNIDCAKDHYFDIAIKSDNSVIDILGDPIGNIELLQYMKCFPDEIASTFIIHQLDVNEDEWF